MSPLAWVLTALGVGAAAKASGKFGAETDFARGILTPGRKDFYERAMRNKGTREEFEKAADLFEKYGLPTHAKMLRARGAARLADEATHQKRREVIRKAFQSHDPMAIERIAEVAESKLGMTVSAAGLRERAKGLREAAALHSAPNVGLEVPGGGDPYVAEPNTVAITGDGGNLASSTQMAGESSGSPCQLNAGGECLVHSTGGGCSVGQAEHVIPPALSEVATQEDPFKRF